MSKSRGSLIEFADFSFDPETCFLRKRGRKVPLKKQSAEVLALLIRNAGEVVSREAIRDHVWKDRLIEFDQGINACIRDIRHALGDEASNPRFVETHPRIGYRFRAPIVEPGHRASRVRLGWILASGALAAAIIAWVMGAFGPLSPPRSDAVEPERIAVMPFQSKMQTLEHAEQAKILTDLFVLQLSQAQSQVLVISADDLFGEGRSDPGMGDISRWLEADYILAGTLHRADGTTTLSLRLVRTDGYVHLWTRSIPMASIESVDINAVVAQIIVAIESAG